jgi:hypothetical protein
MVALRVGLPAQLGRVRPVSRHYHEEYSHAQHRKDTLPHAQKKFPHHEYQLAISENFSSALWDVSGNARCRVVCCHAEFSNIVPTWAALGGRTLFRYL